TQFGGPDVLVTDTAPDSVAGPGQVVVDVAVADTLFVDTQIRRGWGREHFTVRPPYVPGNGGGGVVSSVGDGVDPGWIGRRGAAVVVDYSEPDWAKRVLDATGGTGPDVVFDGAGGEIGRAAFDITARGGRFSAHGAPGGGFTAIEPDEAARRRVIVGGIEQVQFAPADLRRMTERAMPEVAAGRIAPRTGQTFPAE